MMALTEFYRDLGNVQSPLKPWIEHFLSTCINQDGTILPKRNPEEWFRIRGISNLLDEFNEHTVNLSSYSFGDRIKLLLQGFTDSPACKCCGSPVKLVDQLPFTPRPFCSRACSSRFEGSKQKNIDTCMRKYGVSNAAKSPAIMERAKAKWKINYGDHVENPSQSDVIKLKKEITCMRNIGLRSPLMQVHDRADLAHITPEIRKCLDSSEWLRKRHVVDNRTIHEIAVELGVNRDVIKSRLEKFSIDAIKHATRSQTERDMIQLIKRINPDVEYQTNVRHVLQDGKEIDIWIPSINLAIEVNGLYWHSKMDSNYHQNKKLNAIKCGVDLIFVTDHDINNMPVMIENLIASRMGLFNSIIGARQTHAEMIDAKRARAFFNENHLHGFCAASHYAALMLNGDIVMCMSVSKSRFHKKYDFELVRLASKGRTCVTGGFDKLMKFMGARVGHGAIMSYVDLDYFSGKSFNEWEFESYTSPGYFWTNGSSILSRYQTQPHKLQQLLGQKYNDELSERENMTAAGWNKYHNAGNAIYHTTF